jgi:serine/threonine protein kinase
MCFTGHYDLWRAGIHHGDISIQNLMVTREGKMGVLNDFDLVRCAKLQPISRNHDRTGTIPFMALDLLTDKYWCGHLEREYRHDHESFLWVLSYYFLRSCEGVCRPAMWHTHDWNSCRLNKADFLTFLQDYNPAQPDYQPHWVVVTRALNWLKDRVDEQTKAARRFALFGQPFSSPTICSDKDRFLAVASLIRASLVETFQDSDVFASTLALVGDDEE